MLACSGHSGRYSPGSEALVKVKVVARLALTIRVRALRLADPPI
jgi:hypothetical protein